MIFVRNIAGRTSSLRGSIGRVAQASRRSPSWQHCLSRRYASHGHEAKQASSDLPWLIGSVVVTVPVVAYLIQQTPDEGHGHGDDGHGVKHEGDSGHGGDGADDDREDAGDSEGEVANPSAAGDGSDSSEKSSDDDSESDNDNTPQSSDEEGESGSSGVRFKGPTKGGAPEDEREHIPDAKGGAKRRINSSYGQKIGEAEPEADAEGSRKDKPAASKSALGKNQQSGKQEGLSNTDTKHPYDLDNNPEISTKGEGSAETAKLKGTVNPDRPQAETKLKN